MPHDFPLTDGSGMTSYIQSSTMYFCPAGANTGVIVTSSDGSTMDSSELAQVLHDLCTGYNFGFVNSSVLDPVTHVAFGTESSKLCFKNATAATVYSGLQPNSPLLQSIRGAHLGGFQRKLLWISLRRCGRGRDARYCGLSGDEAVVECHGMEYYYRGHSDSAFFGYAGDVALVDDPAGCAAGGNRDGATRDTARGYNSLDLVPDVFVDFATPTQFFRPTIRAGIISPP